MEISLPGPDTKMDERDLLIQLAHEVTGTVGSSSTALTIHVKCRKELSQLEMMCRCLTGKSSQRVFVNSYDAIACTQEESQLHCQQRFRWVIIRWTSDRTDEPDSGNNPAARSTRCLERI